MTTMKAIQIHRYGTPDVMRYEDAPIPTPKRGEVLIRVHGAGVNPIDCKTRAGQGMAWKLGSRFPLIMGWDVAGVVETSDSPRFAPGDSVYGMLNFPELGAGYAQYAVANPLHIARAPDGIDLHSAAAVPLVALTAWQGLFEMGKLQAGQRVLIHAAAGGVGHIAVQLAKWKGAYVIGTASDANFEYLAALGVNHLIDYNKFRFEGQINQHVDLVLNTVSPDVSYRSLDLIKPGGRLVSIVGQAPTKRGIETGWILVRPHPEQLAEIAQLIDARKLVPNIERILPLSASVEAHRLVEGRHVRGKIVLDAMGD
jgi:NADPH:quinone reductase-like Zn-dependent oxidoreductase